MITTLSQWLQACLNLDIKTEREVLHQAQNTYSVGTKKNNIFYELWQQHKQPKTMEINGHCPDIYNNNNNFNLEPLTELSIHKNYLRLNLSCICYQLSHINE